MNIHTRVVGALEAALLAMSALLTIALSLALIDPLADGGRSARLQESAVTVMAHPTSVSLRI